MATTQNLDVIWQVRIGGTAEPAFLPAAAERQPPCLLIEADQDVAQTLKAALGDQGQTSVCAEVLTASAGQTVTWHRYSDQRFNGPLGPEHWQAAYPNLRYLNSEARDGRTLQQVLEAWVSRLRLPVPGLQLILGQGDPLAVLQGLGRWLAAVQRVDLEMPWAASLMRERLDPWLNSQGFRAAATNPHLWERDQLATLQLAVLQREHRIAELEEQLSSQAVKLLLAGEQLTERDQRLRQIDAELDQVLGLLDTSQR